MSLLLSQRQLHRSGRCKRGRATLSPPNSPNPPLKGVHHPKCITPSSLFQHAANEVHPWVHRLLSPLQPTDGQRGCTTPSPLPTPVLVQKRKQNFNFTTFELVNGNDELVVPGIIAT